MAFKGQKMISEFATQEKSLLIRSSAMEFDT